MNFRKRDKKFFTILFVFLFLGIVLLVFNKMRERGPDQENTQMANEQLFKAIIADPIPPQVKDVKGFEYQVGKPDTYLKFEITQDFLPQLLVLHEYKEVSCDEGVIKNTLFAPLTHEDNFSGSKRFWDIDDVKNKICYATFIFNESGIEGKLYSNTLRQKAQSTFLFDKDENVVYFHEQGI